MKKKFSKILGVGLTLALLASFLVMGAPVSADVSEALVDLDDDEISADNIWTITFTVIDALGVGDDIIIIWPDGFDITPIDEATADDDGAVTTDDPDDDLRVGASSGIGVVALVSTSTIGVFTTTEVTDDTLTIDVPGNIGAGATVQVVVGSTTGTAPHPCVNADDIGTYNLIVYTSIEDDEVDSEDFELVIPEPDVPSGVVKLYNPSDIHMESYTGDDAIQQAINDAPTTADFTIKVGEGTYASDVAVNEADITIEAAGDVDDTIIEGAVTISVDGITLDGFTIDGSVTVAGGGDESVLENLVFEGGSTLNIADTADDVEVTDCTFEVEDSLGIDMNEDADVTGCTFTVEDGGVAINVDATADGGTIEDNTFTGDSGEGDGIVLAGDTDVIDNTFDDLAGAIGIDSDEVTLDGNTFKDLEEAAIIVTDVSDVDTDTVTFLHIVNNTFTGCDDDVVLEVILASDLVFFMFNTITDSDGDDGVLVTNDGGAELSAANNWWGDAAGPAEGADAFGGADDTVNEPYLPGAVSPGSALDTITDELDESDGDTGVSVEVTDGAGTMDVVGVAQYAVNPVAAIDNAVGFWDVAVIGTTLAVDEITVRIYTTVTEDTELWVWGAARGEWLQSEDAVSNLFAGFIGVEIDATSIPTIDDLEALPFAVIEPPPTAVIATAPVIAAPVSGDDTVSLTPTFAWGAVPGADAYYFQLADNANFVPPLLAKLDGDLGRLGVTAYAYRTELPYSEAYYWRVKAVSGSEATGDLAESAWTSAVFITMDEPEEPIPPVVIQEAPELPDITITQPDIIIESPDIIVPLPEVAAPITPTWIYVIIGVGGVLVIALIVLVVRTRRVA
ncbi:hypothetical protein ES703_70415 [subsurface metagenome]